MKNISGKITCKLHSRIPTGSTVYVQALEFFVDQSPKLLGSMVIASAKTFPVLFEMSFDERPILEKRYKGLYLLCVSIEKKDKIIFSCDGIPFVIEKVQDILDKIDIEVNDV